MVERHTLHRHDGDMYLKSEGEWVTAKEALALEARLRDAEKLLRETRSLVASMILAVDERDEKGVDWTPWLDECIDALYSHDRKLREALASGRTGEGSRASI